MDNLALMHLFVRVAEAGSFSGAARETHATPSAVSRQMARLEADLGTRLLQRTTRQQVLTEAGEVYLRHARQIIEDVETARRAVTRLGTAPSGVLRVTAEADLAATLISPLLPGFLENHPALRLQLVPSATMEDLVGRGIDVAIRVGHLEDSSLVARRLTVSRSLLVASPGYLERHGMPEGPEALRQHACLSFRVGPENTIWRFRSPDGPTEVPVSGPLQVSSLLMLQEAALAGLGIAMLPVWMAGAALGSGRLVPVLPAVPLDPPATPISAVYPGGRYLASKVRVFVDHLARHIDRPLASPPPGP